MLSVAQGLLRLWPGRFRFIDSGRAPARLCRPRLISCPVFSHASHKRAFWLFPPTAAYVLFTCLQVRVALRASAGLPRLIWGGDHIDEGHRKLLAAELLGSRLFIPDGGGIHNGFLFIDAAVPDRRRVPGFGVRGLVEILKRMKLTEKPTFVADAGGMEDKEECVEDDVVVSDYSGDSAPSYSFGLSFDAADDRRAGVHRAGVEVAAGVGNHAGGGGRDWRCGDAREGEASVCEHEGDDSQYWGLGDDGQGARWDDDDRQGGETFAGSGEPDGAGGRETR